jgi:TolB-like protein/Tfp pilus assembly protein PilF
MNNLLSELRRRNVIKAAVTYAVVSWAMLQVFDTVFPLLDIPPTVLKVILYVLMTGFPLWLILAYIFEWTSDGLKKTEDADAESPITAPAGKKQNILIITGLSVAVLLLAADRFFESSGERTKKSIAVLPFENMSGPDDAYFSAGVTEDILTQISKISDLRVLSRFTLKDYVTKGKTVQQIGEELDAAYLLTGSIRKAGEQLRISCQLVQVQPEEQTWAETYDKHIADIFAIQANVAHEVAKSLRATLTSEQNERIIRKPTENIEAYNHYLLASSLYDNGKSDDNERAIEEFNAALALDPNFVQALTGLIRAYNKSINNYGVRQSSFNDTTFMMAQQALAMDGESADALYTMSYQYLLKRQYTRAIELAGRAVEINPNYSAAINGLGLLKRNTGKIDEAFTLFQQAKSLEPLKLHIFNFNLGTCCKYLGLYPEALQYFESVVDVKKSEAIALEQIGVVYSLMGDQTRIAGSIDRLLAFQNNTKNLNRAAGMAFYGRLSPAVVQRYADAVLRQKDFNYRDHSNAAIAKAYLLQQQGKKDSVQLLLSKTYDAMYAVFGNPVDEGGVYLGYAEIEMLRGNQDAALMWLRKMVTFDNITSYQHWKNNFILQPLRSREEFTAWNSRMEQHIERMRSMVVRSIDNRM